MALKDESEEQQLSQFNVRQRRALNDALGALLGQQTSRTFQAFTFEEAIDLQIERIEGAGTRLRPNLLDRVTRIQQELEKAVEELKRVPPERFLDHDEAEDTTAA